MVERRGEQRSLERFLVNAAFVATGILIVGSVIVDAAYPSTLGGGWSRISESGRTMKYSGEYLGRRYLGWRATLTLGQQTSLNVNSGMARAAVMGDNNLDIIAADVPSLEEIELHIKKVCMGVQVTKAVHRGGLLNATLVVDNASCIATRPE